MSIQYTVAMSAENNRALIENFYTAFQNKDGQTMADSYAADATFYDPVFENLKGVEVGAMWKMLLERSTDLKIEFSDVQADESTGSARWVATYPFSKTGRTIVNKIQAKFVFENGKIKDHKDSFSLWKWARMALGASGLFLGWSGAVQGKIRKEAQGGLKLWMKRKRIQ